MCVVTSVVGKWEKENFCLSFLHRSFHYLFTYLLQWSRVLLEKPTGFAANQEIPRILLTRKFITVLTSARFLLYKKENNMNCSN